jgi:metal-responsive CopG/Arc/MetJ family transcriptional regulator
MEAQLTVRLPEDLNAKVSTAARRLRLKRSDVVRLALQKFLDELPGETGRTPYDRVKHLLGSVESGVSDLGTNHRHHLVERFRRDA